MITSFSKLQHGDSRHASPDEVRTDEIRADTRAGLTTRSGLTRSERGGRRRSDTTPEREDAREGGDQAAGYSCLLSVAVSIGTSAWVRE